MYRYIPNLLTASRIVVTPFLIWLILSGYTTAFTVCFILAALTDRIDGPLARRWQVESNGGHLLDAIADKVFVAGVALALVIAGYMPLFALVLLLVRDISVVVGALIVLAIRHTTQAFSAIPHSKAGTLCTIFQALTVIAFVYDMLPYAFLLLTAIIGVVATVGYFKAGINSISAKAS